MASTALVVVASVLEVERRPRRVRFRCPFVVAVESGRYLQTTVEVMCGKPISCPLSMALQSVSRVGENKHWCRNFNVSDIVVD